MPTKRRYRVLRTYSATCPTYSEANTVVVVRRQQFRITHITSHCTCPVTSFWTAAAPAPVSWATALWITLMNSTRTAPAKFASFDDALAAAITNRHTLPNFRVEKAAP